MASPRVDSWTDGTAKSAVSDFVHRLTTAGGPGFIPPVERIAVFDNDGTLWCEKPMPIEVGFILKHLAAQAERDRPFGRSAIACERAAPDLEAALPDVRLHTDGRSLALSRGAVLHDDRGREFEYVAGAEKSLELAKAQGWTVVSMKNDWNVVFE